MMRTKFLIIIYGLSCFLTNYTGAQSSDQQTEWVKNTRLELWLKEFAENPLLKMDEVPQKWQSLPDGTKAPVFVKEWFSEDQKESAEFVMKKYNLRQTFMSHGIMAPIGSDDQAADVVDRPAQMVLKLSDMEGRGLTQGKVSQTPWSDDYWPTYMGGIANRYGDSNFPGSTNWLENYNYINEPQNTLSFLANNGDAQALSKISPAEKYDLLMGQEKGALSNYAWQQGQAYYDENGEVESWMGICHGWAVASYMEKKPRRLVTVQAQNGKDIKIYPSDLKALTSQLWANANIRTKFIGGRCNEKKPAVDSNGRTLKQNCFDTNPATWHLAVVNQVGLFKRSLVMDATYDHQVWNQPLYAYEYRYFNPQTRKASANIAEAMIEKSAFTNDKFKTYRTRDYKRVVGIEMEVSYIGESSPRLTETDNANLTGVRTVNYVYDLELDRLGNIVGGEWYQNRHPDFLWGVDPGYQITTRGDSYLKTSGLDQLWKGEGKLPEIWRKLGVQGAKNGVPLVSILRVLIDKSQ